MPRAFESDDFMTFFVDVDLWLCTGCLFPILDHDEEESTDGEGQRVPFRWRSGPC